MLKHIRRVLVVNIQQQIVEKIKAEKDIDFYEYYPHEYIWGKVAYNSAPDIYTDIMISADDFKEHRDWLEKMLPDYL